MIGNDIILDEDKFYGDMSNFWHSMTQLKAISFKFIKLKWLFSRDTDCLPIVLDMLLKQTRRANDSLISLMDNQQVCKIIKQGLEVINKFVQIHRNEEIDKFFVENSYKIYLKVLIKFLGFESAISI